MYSTSATHSAFPYVDNRDLRILIVSLREALSSFTRRQTRYNLHGFRLSARLTWRSMPRFPISPVSGGPHLTLSCDVRPAAAVPFVLLQGYAKDLKLDDGSGGNSPLSHEDGLVDPAVPGVPHSRRGVVTK